MAAVEGLLYCGGHPGNGYGFATTQPWTIGWDENDTRIRLKLIARAWIATRSSLKHGGAYQTELVRERRFFYILRNDMDIVVQ